MKYSFSNRTLLSLMASACFCFTFPHLALADDDDVEVSAASAATAPPPASSRASVRDQNAEILDRRSLDRLFRRGKVYEMTECPSCHELCSTRVHLGSDVFTRSAGEAHDCSSGRDLPIYLSGEYPVSGGGGGNFPPPASFVLPDDFNPPLFERADSDVESNLDGEAADFLAKLTPLELFDLPDGFNPPFLGLDNDRAMQLDPGEGQDRGLPFRLDVDEELLGLFSLELDETLISGPGMVVPPSNPYGLTKLEGGYAIHNNNLYNPAVDLQQLVLLPLAPAVE